MGAKKKVKAKTTTKKQEPTPAEQLSEYEQIRLNHIKRNQEFLESLGLFSVKEIVVKDESKNKQKKPKIKPPEMPEGLRRRSERVQNEAPKYTGENIDNFGDLGGQFISSSIRRKRSYEFGEDEDGNEDEDIDYDALKDEMREAAMQHMEQVRLAMLPTAIKDEANAAPDDWRDEACRRWGPAAGAGDRKDWRGYVESRLSTPPPVSPLDFLQEYYAG